jgi:hypothetical protein
MSRKLSWRTMITLTKNAMTSTKKKDGRPPKKKTEARFGFPCVTLNALPIPPTPSANRPCRHACQEAGSFVLLVRIGGADDAVAVEPAAVQLRLDVAVRCADGDDFRRLDGTAANDGQRTVNGVDCGHIQSVPFASGICSPGRWRRAATDSAILAAPRSRTRPSPWVRVQHRSARRRASEAAATLIPRFDCNSFPG